MRYCFTTGLTNIGNTCFMNSVLQVAVHCESLTKVMLNDKHNGDIISAYRNFIKDYGGNNGRTVNPKKLKRAIEMKVKTFQGTRQQDSHEFILALLDQLDEDFLRENSTSENKKIISHLFDTVAKVTVYSDDTKEQSSHRENIRFISTSVPESDQEYTTIDCLDDFFGVSTIDASWKTPSGKTVDNAYKLMTVKRVPKYLLIHLKRYRYDRRHGYKIDTVVKHPEHLEWKNFPEGTKYHLKSFSFQSGGLNSGHYVGYSRVNDNWYCFDDSAVRKVDISHVLSIASRAYLICYEKV